MAEATAPSYAYNVPCEGCAYLEVRYLPTLDQVR